MDSSAAAGAAREGAAAFKEGQRTGLTMKDARVGSRDRMMLWA
jgi:hypothetical protein